MKKYGKLSQLSTITLCALLVAMSADAGKISITLVPTLSGKVDSRYPDGDDGTGAIPLVWATTINNISIQSGLPYSVALCALYLTQVGSPDATVTVATGYSLPTGWSIGSPTSAACTLDYSGTGTTVTTPIKFTATRSGVVASTPNEFTITVVAPPSSDTAAPPIVTGLTATSGVAGQVPVTWNRAWDSNGGEGTDYYQLRDGATEITIVDVDQLTAKQPALTTTNIGSGSGTHTVTRSGNQLTLTCAGTGMDGTADGECFHGAEVSGQVCATAKITSVSDAATYNKAGVEIRASTDANAIVYSWYGYNQDGVLKLQLRRRSTTGGSRGTLATVDPVSFPVWAQLCKSSAGAITGTYSTDGNAFTAAASEQSTLPDTAYIGFSATATSAGVAVVGVLDETNITQGSQLSYTYNTTAAASLTVSACDAAANCASYGSAASATPGAPADTTAPTISVQPTGANNGNSTSLTYTFGCTDNTAVRGYVPTTYTGSTCSAGATVRAEQTATTYAHTGLSANTAYSFKMQCYDTAGNVSAVSNCATATTAASASDPTTAPTISSVTATGTSAPTTTLRVTWGSVTNAHHYRLRYKLASASSYTLLSTQFTSLTTDITGLAVGTTYDFQVAAANASESVITAYSTAVQGTTQSGAGAIKFNPGHYMYTDKLLRNASDLSSRTTAVISQINTQICPYPEITGLQVHITWAVLEPTQGGYSTGFSTVDQIYNALANCQKRLMLVLHERMWNSVDPNPYVPAYIQTSAYGPVQSPGTCVSGTASGYRKGGVILANGTACLFGSGLGVYPVIYESAVMDRLIALSQAYGARYNSASYPYFEMWSPMEELGGSPDGGFGFSNAALSTQVARLFTATRPAWPNTALRLKANWNLTIAQQCALIRDTLAPLNVSVGGPDTLPSSHIWTNQVFSNYSSVCQDFRGVVPWVAEIQNPELGGKAGTYTGPQLFAFGMDGGSAPASGASGAGLNALPLWPQYWVWAYQEFQGGTAQKWSTGIRPFITDTIDGAVGNGLDSTRRTPASVKASYCPTGYAGGCQ